MIFQPAANSSCLLLNSSTFQPCHCAVDPTPYITMCAFDQCVAGASTNNNFDCDAFSAYATACLNQNRFVDGWANATACLNKNRFIDGWANATACLNKNRFIDGWANATACLNKNRFIDGWANAAGCTGPAPQPGDFRWFVCSLT